MERIEPESPPAVVMTLSEIGYRCGTGNGIGFGVHFLVVRNVSLAVQLYSGILLCVGGGVSLRDTALCPAPMLEGLHEVSLL